MSDPVETEIIQLLVRHAAPLRESLGRLSDPSARFSAPVLHGLGISLKKQPSFTLGKEVLGAPSIGVAFIEEFVPAVSDFKGANQDFFGIVAGSSWNRDMLRKFGVENVELVLQGIDPSLCHPAPARRMFGDRFVIFSGGKLEFRKGQDLVVKAFREFSKRRKDALLVTAWANMWPESAISINETRDLEPLIMDANGVLDVGAWTRSNGIVEGSVHHLPGFHNIFLPQILRDADVALFPNRAEGGTNLVAMEAMACGVPVILSANTGHLDLIDGDNAFVLTRQAVDPNPARGGWGTSDVSEIVEHLECIYRRGQEVAARAAAGARFMSKLTWSNQIRELVEVVDRWTP